MRLPAEVAEVTGRFLALIDDSAPGLVQGLYLRGSLAFGEYFAGQSDVDFTAVLSVRPDAGQLTALGAVHEAVFADHPVPHFDGFHLLRDDLARAPDQCPEIPVMFDGVFMPRIRDYDINPVSWHELARHGIAVRGPALGAHEVWTDDAALRAFSYGNLGSYWAGVADNLLKDPAGAAEPGVVAWSVLGVSRLHHLLVTGRLTSKSGAGRYALTAFGKHWHRIIEEALRARERPGDLSSYHSDLETRGRDAAAFTAMAVESGLALGPVAAADG
ncbi:MAG TPA: aminoglycoside adenylyltransferase domain-containing protein [Streptosporangiaceae bacterium]|nr:aminoglycoside adenylyltransferase domain-containing protein [Streptosporangiaceae bacterium]